MTSSHVTAFRLLRRGVLFFTLFVIGVSAWAQNANTGVIRGRVLNASSGNYLNNARVSVPGTNLETYTTATGDFWLTNVPAGQVTVQAGFTGLSTQSATVSVSPGATVAQDFILNISVSDAEGEPLQLEPLSVTAKVMSGQAVALTEQRNAPNIKNVISLDEFVDMADGNLGEFLKFIPGVDIAYNPFAPTSASIRGMPASGTLIQYDGVTLAAPSVAGNRTFDLNTAANANIDRLEISKVPTPDMPANAVGGSINVISKTGFSRKDPLFSYDLYLNYSARRGEFNPTLDKLAGPDDKSTKRGAQFAYKLSYLLPLNDQLAFSFGLTRSPRIMEAEFLEPAWALAGDATPPLVANQSLLEYMSINVTETATAGVEWKVGQYGKLQANYFQTSRDGNPRANDVQWVTNTAGRTGDAHSTMGRGDARQTITWTGQNRELQSTSAIYRHEGPVWKADASVAFSKGLYSNDDISDGHFNRIIARSPSNSINWDVNGHQGVQENPGKAPVIQGTYVSNGQPVNLFDGNILGIISATTNDELSYLNENRSAGFNLGREFDFNIPTSIKVGAYIEESSRDGVTATQTYNFRPNGSNAFADRQVSNFDVLVPEGYTNRQYFTDVAGTHHHVSFVSPAKVYDLYRQNPEWFVLDEDAAHITRVNGSQEVTETITAYYFRMDNKFMDNRLKLTTGVRYEHTEDEGSGPLNDIAATYRRNPDGSFLLDSDGDFVPITTDPLERARLQYTERGATKTTDYAGFYPSINANYTFADNFVIRAGFAQTIGRPDLTRIIPSTTISDPDDIDVTDPDDAGAIRIVDGELDPWSANNYDLTFEAYDFKGVTASVSLFRKDMENFFTTREESATPQMIADLGLPADLVDFYRVVRTVNSGSATIQGVELSYRQSLRFLPGWARHFHVFANFTNQNITGPNEADFVRVAEKMLRAGISYVHPKFVAKLNVSHDDYLKLGTASGGRYTYRSPSTRWDFSTEYRLNRRLAVFFSVRNLTADPQRRSVLDFSFDQPEYSYPRDWRYLPATYSVGIKGRF